MKVNDFHILRLIKVFIVNRAPAAFRHLIDRARPPFERVRSLTHAFLRSECEEAEVRKALGDAAPLYRNAPEVEEAQALGSRVIGDFVREALPGKGAGTVETAADLIMTTLTQVSSSFSETARSDEEIAEYADARQICSSPI